ncbi:hypothetical protein ACFLZZ_04585 [Nanoarchaeota archaeon]
MRKKFSKNLEKVLFWTPRVLMILFIGFLSLFALDVFGEYAFPEVLVALFMHLLPTFALIALLALAWKKEYLGGIAILLLGVVFTLFFNTYREIISFILISLPVFIVGGMFLWHHYIVKK